jgi:cytoskeletal protein RodZ
MSKSSTYLEQEQSRRLAQIGSDLRSMREERGLTLSQMSELTKIQPRSLLALESAHLPNLPEPVYIRGFVKRYAEALGLDGEAYASNFPMEANEPAARPWKNSPAAQLRPIHLYVAYVALIVAAVSGLSHLLSRSSGSITADAPIESSLPLSPQPSAVSKPLTPGVIPSANLSAQTQKPVRVDVVLTAQSWMRVEIDGKTEFQGMLTEGTQRTWTADNQLVVRAGNAGGVLLAHNNGQSTPMGQPGAVRELKFTAEQRSAALIGTQTPAASQ